MFAEAIAQGHESGHTLSFTKIVTGAGLLLAFGFVALSSVTNRVVVADLRFAKVMGVAPGLLKTGAITLLTVAACAGLVSKISPEKAAAFWRNLSGCAVRRPENPSQWVSLIIFCAIVISAFDLTLFVNGSFRLDDFEFLRVANEEPFWKQIFLTHGGHACALFRLEWLSLVTFFGPAVIVFNIANFLGCLALLVAGCWLLAELGVGWLGTLAFVAVGWSWPGWGDFTSGYFTLTAYYQGVTLGFVALSCILHSGKTEDSRWIYWGCASMAGAAFMAIANAWVLVAAPAFAAVALMEKNHRKNLLRPFVFSYAITLACFAIYLVVAFHNSWSLGAHENGALDIPSSIVAVISGVSGVLLSFIVTIPIGVSIAPAYFRGIEWAVVIVTLGGGLAMARKLSPRDRLILASLALVLLTNVAMVVIARRPATNGFFWPAKWTAISHCSAAITLGFMADRWFRLQRGHAAQTALKLTAAILVVWMWSVFAMPAVGSSLKIPAGRPNELAHAKARRADLVRLRQNLETLSVSLGERPVKLPLYEIEALWATFPYIEGYPLNAVQHALPTGLVQVIPGPLNSTRRAAIAAIPDLRRLYLSRDK